MSEINVTPMVDVMLVLLVIFIITAPLLTRDVKVDLPKAEGAQSVQAARKLVVTMQLTGQIQVDGGDVDAHSLEDIFRQAADNDKATELQLRADSALPYGKVVEVMGLAHKAGLQRIGFVAQSPVQGPKK